MRHLTRHIEQANGIDPYGEEAANGIDPYGEEAAYLAGSVGQKMFPVARKFICEHCRKHLVKE